MTFLLYRKLRFYKEKNKEQFPCEIFLIAFGNAHGKNKAQGASCPPQACGEATLFYKERNYYD